jgi:hypothetical protein
MKVRGPLTCGDQWNEVDMTKLTALLGTLVLAVDDARTMVESCQRASLVSLGRGRRE